MANSNADLVRAAYQAFGSGDIEGVAKFLAEDSVWHVKLSGSLSGNYEGRDAVLGFLGRLMEETGGTFRTELHEVVADDTHAVALLTTTGSRNGKSFESKQAAVYHMRDGQSVEAWFLYEDGPAVAEVFA